MDFKHAILSLMADMGLTAPKEDSSQPLTLIFDEKWTLTCELDPQTDEIVFSIPVDAAGKQALEQPGAALKVMTLSLLGAQTGGCALSYSPETECMVVWYRHPNDFSDGQVITKIMNHMVDVAASVDEWCWQHLDTKDEHGQSASPEENPSDSPTSWFRV